MSDYEFENLNEEGDSRDKGYTVVKWLQLAPTMIVKPLEVPAAHYMSVQVIGDFGAGGSVTFKGGNARDMESFVDLPGHDGEPIKLTGPGIVEVGIRTRFIQPVFESNTAEARVDVYLYASR